MKLIFSRTLPFIDAQSLALHRAQEALFRDKDAGYILYLSDGANAPDSEERVIRLETREALIWLNEPPEDRGAFWA